MKKMVMLPENSIYLTSWQVSSITNQRIAVWKRKLLKS